MPHFATSDIHRPGVAWTLADQLSVTPLTIALALAAALCYGAADFLGGFATQRAATLSVAVLSQLAGIATVCLAVAFFPTAHPRPADFAWGATAGLIGGSALALFYHALGRGTMSVIAPITALVAIAVPVVVGLALGERPGIPALLGIGLAICSIALVSATITPSAESKVPTIRGAIPMRSFGTALAAGACFGAFYVVIRNASPEAGIWPLAAARSASVLAYLGAAIVTGRPLPLRAPRTALPLIIGAGVVDMTANICYLLAAHRDMLTIVATLASLYPATTLLLARFVLRERVTPLQTVGLALAACAVVLISAK